ncbi:MAG: hypothetical protein ACI32C_04770 [Candidatus Enteromonas sp.]
MKSYWKKLIGLGVIAGLIGVGAGIDAIIATGYEVTFSDAVRQGDAPVFDKDGNKLPSDVGLTDGQTKMDMTIRVTHHGEGVADHVLYVMTNRGVVGRMRSDGEGYVRFSYDCYYSEKAADVVFTAKDEDNSIFVSIPAQGTYTLKMKAATSSSGGLTTDDIFHDLEGF